MMQVLELYDLSQSKLQIDHTNTTNSRTRPFSINKEPARPA
jgi:hypothetical protein